MRDRGLQSGVYFGHDGAVEDEVVRARSQQSLGMLGTAADVRAVPGNGEHQVTADLVRSTLDGLERDVDCVEQRVSRLS